MSKMDMNSIREMSKEGMSQKDIAYVMECSRQTISAVLNERLTEVDQIADRMEHFVGGAIGGTGNFENGEEMIEFTDPTFEQVAFEEELEQFIEDLEDIKTK